MFDDVRKDFELQKMNKQKQQENEIGENDLVSYLEEKFGDLKPYWSHITLGICAVVLGILGALFFWQQGKTAEAAMYQNLAAAQDNYRVSLDNQSLKDLADQNPDHNAGMWALLYAADAELRGGLTDFTSDKKAGFDKIKKAQDYYKQIVDSTVKKSTMLQRRSTFGLAYAYESNGDFDEAAKLYEQFTTDENENPFTAEAKRGLNRCNDKDMVALFEKFRNFEVAPEIAPGLQLPKRPDISFPDPEEQPNSGGGDFSADASSDADAENNADVEADADAGKEAEVDADAESTEATPTTEPADETTADANDG